MASPFNSEDNRDGISADGRTTGDIDPVDLVRQYEKEVARRIEMEQERIGQDLHDGVCQILWGLKLRSAALAKKIQRGDHDGAYADAVRLEEELSQTLVLCRDLSKEFNPADVEAKGLLVALLELSRSVESSGVVRCRCQFRAATPILNRIAIRNLYRIAQEAVQNALKHGKARNILITLQEADGGLCLMVQDDGVGLPDHDGVNRGHGLRNIRSRAALIGATVDFQRGTPAGLTVRVWADFGALHKPQD